MIIDVLVQIIASIINVAITTVTIINVAYPFFSILFSVWRIGNSGGLRGFLLLGLLAGAEVDARRCICR